MQIKKGFNKSDSYRLKAQAMLEYAVFVTCVVAALLVMQIYIKRGIEGRLKQSGDDIGDQYASKGTTSTITTEVQSSASVTYEKVDLGLDSYKQPMYGTKTVTSSSETTTRSGSEETGQLEDTLF